jgi:anti-sigma B factor antagonist
MRIAEDQAGSVTVVAIDGRIDTGTANALEEKLTGLFKSGRNRVVVDCRNLAYITSAGLRVLLRVAKLADRSDGKLALCDVSSEVRRVFDLGEMTSLFAIFPSRDEGIAKLS